VVLRIMASGMCLCIGFAAAGEPISRALELGGRIGYGTTVGNIDGSGATSPGNALSDEARHLIPIAVEIGMRLSPAVRVGVFGQYAWSAEQSCLDAMTCSGADIRLGIDVQYSFARTPAFTPWVGVGLGYEILSLHMVSIPRPFAVQVAHFVRHRGFELSVEGGVDFSVAPGLRLGPLVAVALGQYSGTNFDGEGYRDIQSKAIHGQILLGLRAVYAIGL